MIIFLTFRNFEPYKHFMLPENRKIDSSLQMQALAMQYLSPEQAVKCKSSSLCFFINHKIRLYLINTTILIIEINNNSHCQIVTVQQISY